MENKIDFKKYFEMKIQVDKLSDKKKSLNISALIEFYHMEREVISLGSNIKYFLSEEEKKYLVLRYHKKLPMNQVVKAMAKSRSLVFVMDKVIRDKLKDKL